MSCFNLTRCSRCNRSWRCCHRAREHVDPTWSRKIRCIRDSHPETPSSPGSVGYMFIAYHGLFTNYSTCRWRSCTINIQHLSCEIGDFVETHLRKLRVTYNWIACPIYGFCCRGVFSFTTFFLCFRDDLKSDMYHFQLTSRALGIENCRLQCIFVALKPVGL